MLSHGTPKSLAVLDELGLLGIDSGEFWICFFLGWRKNKAKGFILFEGGLLQGLVCFFFFVFLVGVVCCSCLVVDGLLIGLIH